MGVVVREIPLWTPAEQEKFVVRRVSEHQLAEEWRESTLPLCTPEERWHRPDTWAVKKKGNKRASRVFEEPVSANEYAAKTLFMEVEHRPGVDIRCASYCRVAQFCDHGRAVHAVQEGTNDDL